MGRRHHSTITKLNRNTKQRRSLFKIQLRQLIEFGQITTTVTKAKVIKRLFDRLAAKAQTNTLAARRRIAAELSNPKVADRLVDLILPVMGDRHSGFTTIQKIGLRKGDSTAAATLKLIVPLPAVEKEKPAVEKKKEIKPKTK